jgi:hypothetical protein
MANKQRNHRAKVETTRMLSSQTTEKLFTAGHAAKGLIYILIGAFALATVIGAARSTSGPKAVIDWVSANPFGQVMLALIGAGLSAYAIWRFYLVIFDPTGESSDKKGKVKRIGWVVSGTAYAALGLYAFQQLLNGNGSKGTKEDVIAMLLAQPWGQIAVAAVGVIVTGTGCYQLYRAITDAHMEQIKEGQLNEEKRAAFRITGRVGLTARFVVYGIMGYYLVRAALTTDSGKFRGLGEALASLQGNTIGAGMLAVTGVGLMAYGLFMLVKARYGVRA